jgi:hypothetical protein
MCATLPIRSRSAIANDEIESVVRGRRTKRTIRPRPAVVRYWHKADIGLHVGPWSN